MSDSDLHRLYMNFVLFHILLSFIYLIEKVIMSTRQRTEDSIQLQYLKPLLLLTLLVLGGFSCDDPEAQSDPSTTTGGDDIGDLGGRGEGGSMNGEGGGAWMEELKVPHQRCVHRSRMGSVMSLFFVHWDKIRLTVSGSVKEEEDPYLPPLVHSMLKIPPWGDLPSSQGRAVWERVGALVILQVT